VRGVCTMRDIRVRAARFTCDAGQLPRGACVAFRTRLRGIKMVLGEATQTARAGTRDEGPTMLFTRATPSATLSGADERRSRSAALCRTYGPAVYRRCLRMLGDHRSASEATEAVLVALARDARVLRAVDERGSLLKRAYDAATDHCAALLGARGALTACTGAI
jgi:hypothetical protein